jgi:hypothetical protein
MSKFKANFESASSYVRSKRGQPGVNPGSRWGQAGVKLGPSWGQAGGNLGAAWGKAGVNLRSTWGQPAPPYQVGVPHQPNVGDEERPQVAEPGGHSSLHHPMPFEPSLLESNGSRFCSPRHAKRLDPHFRSQMAPYDMAYDVASNICQAVPGCPALTTGSTPPAPCCISPPVAITSVLCPR